MIKLIRISGIIRIIDTIYQAVALICQQNFNLPAKPSLPTAGSNAERHFLSLDSQEFMPTGKHSEHL
jgi:hypothetical protein